MVVGFTSGRIPQAAANHVLIKNYSVVGLHWGLYTRRAPELIRRAMHTLFELYAAGQIKPYISKRLPLAEAPRGAGDRRRRQEHGQGGPRRPEAPQPPPRSASPRLTVHVAPCTLGGTAAPTEALAADQTLSFPIAQDVADFDPALISRARRRRHPAQRLLGPVQVRRPAARGARPRGRPARPSRPTASPTRFASAPRRALLQRRPDHRRRLHLQLEPRRGQAGRLRGALLADRRLRRRRSGQRRRS